MKQNCFFCGHEMVKLESRQEVRNGETRQITEFKCINPECGNHKVLDEPSES